MLQIPVLFISMEHYNWFKLSYALSAADRSLSAIEGYRVRPIDLLTHPLFRKYGTLNPNKYAIFVCCSAYTETV